MPVFDDNNKENGKESKKIKIIRALAVAAVSIVSILLGTQLPGDLTKIIVELFK